jgi:hypothetical protein
MLIASITFKMVTIFARIINDANNLFYVEWGNMFQIASGMHAL